MKKVWKAVGVLALIMVILGAILIGVGFVTGADTSRIYSVLDNQYLLTDKIDWLSQVFDLYSDALFRM